MKPLRETAEDVMAIWHRFVESIGGSNRVNANTLYIKPSWSTFLKVEREKAALERIRQNNMPGAYRPNARVRWAIKKILGENCTPPTSPVADNGRER